MKEDVALISEPTLTSLLLNIVVPALQSAVDAWSPASDSLLLHSWLLPWTAFPQISAFLQDLWPSVRQKFAAALHLWSPSDLTAAAALTPWKRVWKPAAMRTLLEACVLPKLELILSSLTINPAAQDVLPVQAVLAWSSLLPPDCLAALLSGCLMPTWHFTLQKWLRSSSVSLAEVAQWYQGWRALIPDSLLGHTLLQAFLTSALNMMRAVVQKEGPIAFEAAAAAIPMCRSYNEAVQEAAIDAEASRATATAAMKGDGSASSAPSLPTKDARATVSFRDAIEMAAAEAGLGLLPAVTRGRVRGKQVYLLGTSSVIMEDGLLLVENRLSSGRVQWRPSGIEAAIASASK